MCNIVKLLPYTFDRGKDMFVPSLLYALHGYFSLTALEGMNLPMYGAVKRWVPMLTMWMSFVVLRKQRPSREIVISVALISLGAFLAGMNATPGDFAVKPSRLFLAQMAFCTDNIPPLCIILDTERHLFANIRFQEYNERLQSI